MIKIIDIESGNIGVKLSGGADSSILYYAVCEKYKDNDNVNVIPISLNTDLKNWYVQGAKNVIAKVGELTGKYPLDHLTNTVEHSLENYTLGQEELHEQAIKKYNVKIMYTGLTYNPPMEDFENKIWKNYKAWGLDKDVVEESITGRDTSRDQEQFSRECEPTDRSPFKDKVSTYNAYKDYDMMDKLYPYTFSCEQWPQDLDNLTHCGQCFFCLERWYAFERIV